MDPAEIIVDQLHRSLYGEAWHGPSLREVLQDISAENAAMRYSEAHTIWELVLHITAWQKVGLRRLSGEPAIDLAEDEDFPLQGKSTPEWELAQAELFAAGEELKAAVRSLPEKRFGQRVPEQIYDNSHMLHGIVQHNLYHAGQIALLKKLR